MRRQERARTQLKPPDITKPHRETQWTQEPLDHVVPGEAVAEEAGEIVEERMAHGLEADEAAFVILRCVRRKRTEPVVLPQDVVAALGPVSDPQPPLARQTDKPTVAKQRAKDHLELQGVRRDPMQRGAGMFAHTDEFDRRLRPQAPAALYFENRRRFPMSESVASNRFTRCLKGKSDGETAIFATARMGCRETHSFGIQVRANGSLGST